MKKILLSTLLSLSIAMAGTDTYLAEIDGLTADAKKIETALVDKSLEYLSTDSELESKLSYYEQKTTAFLESLSGDLTDPELAKQMLDKVDALSQSTLSLAQSVVNLADKTSTNANSSYLSTLETLTQTTLRLSDDIGLMADRIGEMADRIGEMADRIVYTEELISKNAEMINNSMLTVIDKFDFQQNSQGQNSSGNMPSSVTPNIPMPATPPSMPGGF